MGLSRDQDHRRALQSVLSGKLPRADRHHLGLRQCLDAVLPDGRAAARRVDEGASGRAPSGMALRDRQTGWQGSLGWKAAFLESPDYPAPLVRNEGAEREMVMMRWGMRPPPRAGGFPVTNNRTLACRAPRRYAGRLSRRTNTS